MTLSRRDRDHVRRVAGLVRGRALAFARLVGIPHSPELRGLCGIAADGVTRSLVAAGFSARNVHGRFWIGSRGFDHCWTEVDVGTTETVVVDVTAMQFAEALRAARFPSRVRPVTIATDRIVVGRSIWTVFGWFPKVRGAGFDRSLRRWEEQFRATQYRRLRWWEEAIAS